MIKYFIAGIIIFGICIIAGAIIYKLGKHRMEMTDLRDL